MKIHELKKIREKLGFTHLVIYGKTSDGKTHVGTHGDTNINALEASDVGNHLKKLLKFPDYMCELTPLKRICGNCHYYQSYYGIPDAIEIDRYDATGCCSLTPIKYDKHFEEFCIAFEPKLDI
jgi:hypothetical protein